MAREHDEWNLTHVILVRKMDGGDAMDWWNKPNALLNGQTPNTVHWDQHNYEAARRAAEAQ